jgi:heme-degrading monooxygenase HmoA
MRPRKEIELIVRIWRTRVLPQHEAAYEDFARERSLPMFREQVGFLGVFFAKSVPERAVITLWRDQDDVRRLEESPTYRRTVEQLIQAGILDGASDVEVLVTHGYELATVMLNSDEMR